MHGGGARKGGSNVARKVCGGGVLLGSTLDSDHERRDREQRGPNRRIPEFPNSRILDPFGGG